MADDWKKHFKYYDFFQKNCDFYNGLLEYHLGKHENVRSILDTGTGTGNLALAFTEKGIQVTAVDSSERAIEILRGKSTYIHKIDVKLMNVEELELPGLYDGATSMLVIPFVENNPNYFQGVYNYLKNNGLFTITAWAPGAIDMEKLDDLWAKNLTQKGILPAHQKEFDYIHGTSKEFIEIIKERGLTKDQLQGQLEDAGFGDVTFQKNNPYEEFWYSLSCRK